MRQEKHTTQNLGRLDLSPWQRITAKLISDSSHTTVELRYSNRVDRHWQRSRQYLRIPQGHFKVFRQFIEELSTTLTH